MPNPNIIIAPSILAADLNNLQSEVESVEPYVEWLQVDVMDGRFVDNVSFDAQVVKGLKTNLLIDVHLMVIDPDKQFVDYIKAGAKHITFHAEAIKESDQRKALIQAIKSEGVE